MKTLSECKDEVLKRIKRDQEILMRLDHSGPGYDLLISMMGQPDRVIDIGDCLSVVWVYPVHHFRDIGPILEKLEMQECSSWDRPENLSREFCMSKEVCGQPFFITIKAVLPPDTESCHVIDLGEEEIESWGKVRTTRKVLKIVCAE